jgi:hypothetical protein
VNAGFCTVDAQLIAVVLQSFLRTYACRYIPRPSSDMDTEHYTDEKTIYVFLFWEMRGLTPNFHVHVSVSDLYIPRIGPHLFLEQKRRIDRGIYKSLTDTCMWCGNWNCGRVSGNFCFEFSVLCLCSVGGAVIRPKLNQIKPNMPRTS